MKNFSILILFFICFIANVKSQISLDSSIVWSQAVGSVTRIDISPDSKYIALAMQGGIIKLYSLKSGVFYKELRANNGRIWSVKYSDDGKYLISGGRDFVEYKGDDGLITIWDTSTWDTLKTIRIDYYDGNIFTTISHDNKYLAYSLAQKGIEIIDFNTGKLFKKFLPFPAGYGERQMPNCLDFSKDGRYIAVSAQFNPGRLIDIQNNSDAIVDNCNEWSFAVAISNDGTKFVSGCEDNPPNNGINIYDIPTKSNLGKIQSAGRVWDISISPNNLFLAIGSDNDDPITIWDINNAKVIATAKFGCRYSRFSPDSNYIVISDYNKLTLINLKKITDVQENGQDLEFRISPNPATDFIEISVKANGRSPLQSDVRIYNLLGEIPVSYTHLTLPTKRIV